MSPLMKSRPESRYVYSWDGLKMRNYCRQEWFLWQMLRVSNQPEEITREMLREEPCGHADCANTAVTSEFMELTRGDTPAFPVCAEHRRRPIPVDQVTGKVRLVNLTPHPFTIIRDGEPVLTVQPEPASARCAEDREQAGAVSVDGVEVPVDRIGYGTVTGLPDPEDGVVYLVSQLVVAAQQGRTDLVYPSRVVRDSTGQIIGAEGVARPA